MKRIKDNPGFGILLSLVLPGSGHVYFRDYLFGVFVFLIMLIAAVLVFVVMLIDLPPTLLAVLFSLPLLFYVFSFVDLWKSAQKKPRSASRSIGVAWLFLAISLAIALLTPISPGNFFWRNRPEIAAVEDSSMAPLLEPDDLILVDRLAYRVNLFFLDGPLDRADPERWDLVKFADEDGGARIGLVLGFAGEELSASEGDLYVDAELMARPGNRRAVRPGELPLTRVEFDAILLATLDQGVVDSIFQVSRRRINGEVLSLF